MALAGSNHEGLAVDTPELPQAKTPHAMPLLAFPEQRFDPNLALVQGFLIGSGLLVPFHSFHIVGKKGPMDVPTTRAFGTLRFHQTDVADRRISTVLDPPRVPSIRYAGRKACPAGQRYRSWLAS